MQLVPGRLLSCIDKGWLGGCARTPFGTNAQQNYTSASSLDWLETEMHNINPNDITGQLRASRALRTATRRRNDPADYCERYRC